MTPTYGALDIPAYVTRTTNASGVPHFLQDEPTQIRLAVAFADTKKTAPVCAETASHLPKERNQ